MPQNEISKTLQNILCYEEQHGHNEDSMNEETFIRVYLDVIQVEKTMHNPLKGIFNGF